MALNGTDAGILDLTKPSGLREATDCMDMAEAEWAEGSTDSDDLHSLSTFTISLGMPLNKSHM